MTIQNYFRFATLAVTLFFCTNWCMAQTTFDVVEINHTVKDYAVWRKAFDADSTIQKANGLSLVVVGRGLDNPNNLSVVLTVADVQKAKTFIADPRLKDVMEKNGVISKPDIAFYKVVRFTPSAAPDQPWVAITVPVKDFDTWLKVFDAEGLDARKSQGSTDVAITHGIDDPNLVHLIFDINDMAKFNAAMASDAKRKVIMDSGVTGPPKVEFYKEAK